MFRVGLDYHQRRSSICILDVNGKCVKRLSILGTWIELLAALKKLREQLMDPMEICFEASCGYGHLYEQLRTVATRVVVAHPGQLRVIFRSKKKNDRIDAEKLAKLLFLDAVPQVHVPSVNVRSWRMTIEYRRRLIGKRTKVKNALRSLLRTHGILSPKYLWTGKGLRWLKEQVLPTELDDLRREMLLGELAEMEKRIKRVETVLGRIAHKHPGVALLMTAPGVGIRTAEAVVAYIDQPDRFSSVRKIGAYFGIVPCQDSSAAVNRLGHITGDGPGTVRMLLCEAAWQGIRRDAHLRQHFERICKGDPDRRKIAMVATAHHLLRCLLAMLRTGEAWRHEREPAKGPPGSPLRKTP